MSGRRIFHSPWLPVGLWVLLIFGLSSLSGLKPPEVGIPFTDKIAHLGEYGVLGFLVARAAWRQARGLDIALRGIVLGLLLGSFDEMYQGHRPGREVSSLDATADLVGVILGGLAWRLWRRRAARRRLPPGDAAARSETR